MSEWIQRIMVYPESVNSLLGLLRHHGIEAEITTQYDPWTHKVAVQWLTDERDPDLDFLRPHYLPPKGQA